MRRVSSRSARVRAPTETLALQAALGASAQPLARHEQSTGLFVSGLASSPPHRRASAHPPTALRGSTWFLVGERPQPGIEPGWRLHARLRRAASHGLDARGLPFTHTQERLCPQGGGRGAGGANGAAEKRRAEVGARTRALRDLTHRECSSATNAVSAASFAVRPQTEHRREPSRSEGERRLSPDCAPPAALLAHRPRPSAFADVRERTQRAESRRSLQTTSSHLTHVAAASPAPRPACDPASHPPTRAQCSSASRAAALAMPQRR